MWTYNYNCELCHHGVKGQRWGFRRFQRKDGSLTALGKKRYSSQKDPEPEETLEQRKARILKSHSAKEIYKNKDLFDDKELSNAYNRLNTENNIKQLVPKEVSRGRKFIDSYTNTSKTIKDVVNASDDLYKSYVKGKALLDALTKKA